MGRHTCRKTDIDMTGKQAGRQEDTDIDILTVRGKLTDIHAHMQEDRYRYDRKAGKQIDMLAGR